MMISANHSWSIKCNEIESYPKSEWQISGNLTADYGCNYIQYFMNE